MSYQHVILLQVFLRFELDYSEREVKALRRLIGSAKPCMHGAKHMGFVLKTRETPAELVERLRPALDVDNVVDWTAVSVLGNAVGKHGGFNSLVTGVNFAYAALERNPTKYLADSQTVIVPNLRQGAAREMGVERGRNRQSPK